MTQNATVEMRNSSELGIQKLQPLLLRLVRTAPSETQAETEALKKKSRGNWRHWSCTRDQSNRQIGPNCKSENLEKHYFQACLLTSTDNRFTGISRFCTRQSGTEMGLIPTERGGDSERLTGCLQVTSRHTHAQTQRTDCSVPNTHLDVCFRNNQFAF